MCLRARFVILDQVIIKKRSGSSAPYSIILLEIYSIFIGEMSEDDSASGGQRADAKETGTGSSSSGDKDNIDNKNNYNGYEDSGKMIDISALSFEEYSNFKTLGPLERQKRLNSLIIDSKDSRRTAKMSFIEELTMVLVFAFGVPGAVITIPATIAIMYYLIGTTLLKTLICSMAVLVPLAFWPQKYHISNKDSWLAWLMIRYFSFKIIRGGQMPANDLEHPIILVAPPHGVFPFGNILTMIGYPTIMGYDFTGLAASAVFKTPVFRQCLTAVGAADVGKETLTKLLNEKRTVGISTGGVAEVFETKNKDEVIILSERKGIVKMAMKTGADLVPCYLFGNTKLLSLWTGGSAGHGVLKRLSRKFGIALIVFWGRLGLPIPYRVPILGVMGNRIKVTKTENPSDSEINRIHTILCNEMQELFDRHKHEYGWENKKLVIV